MKKCISENQDEDSFADDLSPISWSKMNPKTPKKATSLFVGNDEAQSFSEKAPPKKKKSALDV